MDPKSLRYAPSHEWASLSNGVLTLGISAFAADQLGDVTLVDMKKPGTKVDAGQSCGEIESVKSVNDVYAPVAGEIVETNNKAVNEALNGDSRALTTDPFGKFWLVKLKVAPTASLDHLMDAAAYEKHAASEAGH
jgi:glycine cleavage system H protein